MVHHLLAPAAQPAEEGRDVRLGPALPLAQAAAGNRNRFRTKVRYGYRVLRVQGTGSGYGYRVQGTGYRV